LETLCSEIYVSANVFFKSCENTVMRHYITMVYTGNCTFCMLFLSYVSILTAISALTVIRCHKSYVFKLQPTETSDKDSLVIHNLVKPAYNRIPGVLKIYHF
jgi:hypothetical protein